MHLINTILDIFFPANCLSCGKNDKILCSECLADFPASERECEKWVYPLFDYRHPPVKKAIWTLKYKNKKILAKILAESMHQRILEELSDLTRLENFQNPILIPIPIAPKRLRERGFNQSLLICQKLQEIDKDHNFILGKNILTRKILSFLKVGFFVSLATGIYYFICYGFIYFILGHSFS